MTLRDKLTAAAMALAAIDLDRHPFSRPAIRLGAVSRKDLAAVVEALGSRAMSVAAKDADEMVDWTEGTIDLPGGAVVGVGASCMPRPMSEAERLVHGRPLLPDPDAARQLGEAMTVRADPRRFGGDEPKRAA